MVSRLGLVTLLVNCGIASMALILAAFCLIGIGAIRNWEWRISAAGYVVIGILSFLAGLSASMKILHWDAPRRPAVSQFREMPPRELRELPVSTR